ncbi:hypothetical protein SBP02_11820 [Pseudomonas benzenivorans]|uniref:Phage holin T7 family, holin superfamily II n=1 Tax=Pseudomonas benzenivorans TaxID=556533 RepID=A0ABZ0PS14_9PSED|nr:hypothetical protein [Pseudomonas benzenivorans]WPC03472.1 hypothetical protein SBP02_11820 [Pseudomonas benzenivorans]
MSPAHQNIQDFTVEAIKSAPPVTVSAAMLMGISVQDWAVILTVIYLVLQIFFLLKRELTAKKKKEKESGDAT